MKKTDPHSSHPRSKSFRVTRQHHLLEAAEDYTELALELIEEQGEARIGQLAQRLGLSHVTVLRTVRRLVKEGFLVAEHHQPLLLTPKGKRTALKARTRHLVLVRFLRKLGVPEHIAEVDTEGIEHHISDTTLRAIRRFLGGTK
jgi:DtxR family transcriptional regulator, manganese transport regulator